MSYRRPHLRSILEVLILLVTVAFLFEAVRRSDRQILETYNRQRYSAPAPVSQLPAVSDEERRVAEAFAADTLPRLMQKGLVDQVVRGEHGTVVKVAGTIWEARSRFFKESLLKALLVYNKAQGNVLSTRIIDNRTGKLYAQGIDLEHLTVFDE